MKRFALAVLVLMSLTAGAEAACRGGRCSGKKPARSLVGRILGR